ncbi:hypothetical protein R83H12_00473 [Fibrobacteria bacterium R8-3-H12]
MQSKRRVRRTKNRVSEVNAFKRGLKSYYGNPIKPPSVNKFQHKLWLNFGDPIKPIKRIRRIKPIGRINPASVKKIQYLLWLKYGIKVPYKALIEAIIRFCR